MTSLPANFREQRARSGPNRAGTEPDQHRRPGQGRTGEDRSSRTGTGLRSSGGSVAKHHSEQDAVRTGTPRFGGAAHLRPEGETFTRPGCGASRGGKAESGPGQDGPDRTGPERRVLC